VACTLALGLFAVVGCGDTSADPIVSAAGTANGGGGNDGSGGRGTGNGGDLCAPCGSRFDCNDMESCVQLSRGTSHFCSHACGNGNGRCPSGYLCTDVYNVSSMMCVPETGDCQQVVP
jgi:hypothetical protein